MYIYTYMYTHIYTYIYIMYIYTLTSGLGWRRGAGLVAHSASIGGGRLQARRVSPGVEGVGFRVEGLGCRIEGLGLRV